MRVLHLARGQLLVSLLLPTIVHRPDAGATQEIGGTIALTADPAAVPGKDAAGQPAFIGESKGKNQSTGSTEFMNGAAIATADTANLVNGTGPHHGWITMSKGADAVVFAWKGQVTTVLAADRTPRSTMAGTWTALRGSGRYAGAKGRGTYTGRFTSATASVIEWKGTIGR